MRETTPKTFDDFLSTLPRESRNDDALRAAWNAAIEAAELICVATAMAHEVKSFAEGSVTNRIAALGCRQCAEDVAKLRADAERK